MRLFGSFLLFISGVWGQAPQVTLELAGVPAELFPALQVTLPSGRKVAVAKASEFQGQEAGKYRVTGDPFRVPGPIVDTILEAAPVEAVVKAGEKKTLRLSYSKRGGTGMMWVATVRINEDTDDLSKGTVRGIDEATLQAGGFSKGTAEILTGPRLGGGFIAADGSFHFVDNWDNNALMRLTPTALARGGKPTQVPGSEAHAFALDPKGNLWEAHGGVLRRFNASSWTNGLPANPAAEFPLTVDGDDAVPAAGLLFTATGDLLLYDRGRIARFAAAKLASGHPLSRATAASFVEFDGGSTGQGAIDANGDFWLADENSEIVQIPKATLEKGGKARGTRYEVPQSATGVTVDNSGGVWALIRYTGQIFYRAPGGRSFTEKGVFGRGFDEGSRLTLNPPPPWSPLVQPGMPKRLEAAQ